MELKSKTRFLQCRIEDRYMDKVVISTVQSDQTPMYGEVFQDQLQANLLEVEVVKENYDNALIIWPILYCCANDICGGEEIWISKKFLI